MHKTQGFANYTGGGGGGPRYESFQLLGGEPAEKDILDGVDTTWGRVTGGDEIGKLTDDAIATIQPARPGRQRAGAVGNSQAVDRAADRPARKR